MIIQVSILQNLDSGIIFDYHCSTFYFLGYYIVRVYIVASIYIMYIYVYIYIYTHIIQIHCSYAHSPNIIMIIDPGQC